MIDLHTHTNESDGTLTPAELVDRALAMGLEALAITDHDTLAGYDQAVAPARAGVLDLVCAIELSAKMPGNARSVHVLGYFVHQPPTGEFRAWVAELLASRRDRNIRLVDQIQKLGVPLQLEEVERVGRSLTGRPHFARVLVEKGYASDYEDAFRKYLDEAAPSFVERDGPALPLAAQRITAGGGLAVIAHPIRLGLRDPTAEETMVRQLKDQGLGGIEVHHSDHSPREVGRYIGYAKKYDLAITGGSDFHGDIKPNIALGTGRHGNVQVPRSVLDALRRR